MVQRLGREFSKKEAVVPGEAAELPNTKLGRHVGHSRYRRISGLERSPRFLHPHTRLRRSSRGTGSTPEAQASGPVGFGLIGCRDAGILRHSHNLLPFYRSTELRNLLTLAELDTQVEAFLLRPPIPAFDRATFRSFCGIRLHSAFLRVAFELIVVEAWS
jgi:hypothetical protein